MGEQTSVNLKAKSKFLEGLNAEQEKAVMHGEGPLLIVAGAGTGKTTVITRRIAYLIENGVKPENILALAFGEKAAGEMEERIDLLLPTGGYYNLQVSTFHAFGEHILREYGIEIGLPDFKVLDQVGQWLLIRNNLDKFNLDYYRPLGSSTKFIKAMLTHFSRLKDELITPQEYLDYAEKIKVSASGSETQNEEGGRLQEIAGAYHTYNKLLLDNSSLDFADLINYTLELFKKRPKILEKLRAKYQYILVDEFQDTNLAQYELVKLLAEPRNNITVVGDDDQSIYKFRGASISNILHFQKDYPKSKFISLTDNYRSGQKILDQAYGFIQANNPDRLEVKLQLSKKLKSQTDEKGEITHLHAQDYLEEVNMVIERIQKLVGDGVSYNDFAILSRSHTGLDPFLNKFDALQIPYIYFANKGLYNKPIILDILAYFRLLDNYHESASLFRVLKLPVFSVASKDIIELGAFAKRRSLSLYSALKQAATLELAQESVNGGREVLRLTEKHSETARHKSVEQLFVEVSQDLQFGRLIKLDTYQGQQNARYLEMFHRRIQDFQNESPASSARFAETSARRAGEPDKSLKAFMATINLELEAGEEGDLEVDPEAGPEAVKLMTVHAAKGLEFKYVFVVNLVDKRFPSIERREQIEIPTELVREILPEGDIHLEEERRLFYVAMTRAKSGLYLTSAADYGGKRTKKPSQFLVELGLVEKMSKKPSGRVELTPYPAGVPAHPLPQGERASLNNFLPLPKYFSFSQISLFKRCPLEYKYRYLMHLPVPGNGNMSFGLTIHATFEKYLRAYHQTLGTQDLFGNAGKGAELPALDQLERFYEQSWIGEWYSSPDELAEYRDLGRRILKEFYAECQANRPQPKYLEKSFRLKLGPYYFTGKMDRADENETGLIIIDYKTGAPRTIADVDKQQLLIYQWAATEILGEKVADLQYWYFRDKLQKRSFLGESGDIDKLKANFLETIEEIIHCTKRNDFLTADQQTSHKTKCKYLELEL